MVWVLIRSEGVSHARRIWSSSSVAWASVLTVILLVPSTASHGKVGLDGFLKVSFGDCGSADRFADCVARYDGESVDRAS